MFWVSFFIFLVCSFLVEPLVGDLALLGEERVRPQDDCGNRSDAQERKEVPIAAGAGVGSNVCGSPAVGLEDGLTTDDAADKHFSLWGGKAVKRGGKKVSLNERSWL